MAYLGMLEEERVDVQALRKADEPESDRPKRRKPSQGRSPENPAEEEANA
jgi:hypothetical protein